MTSSAYSALIVSGNVGLSEAKILNNIGERIPPGVLRH